MGWETRNGRGRYYTESYREDGQVKRRYIGAGPVAEALAAVDEEMRQIEQARREREKAELSALAAQDAPLDDWHPLERLCHSPLSLEKEPLWRQKERHSLLYR